MVGERRLEHVVHGAQVASTGSPFVIHAGDQAHDHPVPFPPRPVVDQPGLLADPHRPLHLPPGADLVNPAADSHRRCRSSSANAPVSICCTSRPRLAPTLAPGRPPTRSAGRSRSGRPLRRPPFDHVRGTASGRWPGRARSPRPGPAPPSSRTTTFCRVRSPVVGHLDEDVVLAGAAQPRPSCSCARNSSRSAGVRHRGRRDPVIRPSSPPAAPRAPRPAPRGPARTGSPRGSQAAILPHAGLG